MITAKNKAQHKITNNLDISMKSNLIDKVIILVRKCSGPSHTSASLQCHGSKVMEKYCRIMTCATAAVDYTNRKK